MHIAAFGEEYAIGLGGGNTRRVVVLPALFDEANKLRRFTLDVMRALERAGISSMLIDLPGTNESLAPLSAQTITGWREVVRKVEATEILAIRGGALLAPDHLPISAYAPVSGSTILRSMLRAAVLSEREAGREVTRESLLERGRSESLVLAGHALSPAMLAELEAAEPPATARIIAASDLGGPGLWLRAEPGEDAAQSAKLAALLA